MAVIRRGKIYWAYFYIDGVRKQLSTGTSNKRRAQIIEQQLREEANNERHHAAGVDPRITVARIVARFLADGQPGPHHKYQLVTLMPFFGDTEVRNLNRNMARAYRQWRKQLKPSITEASINRALSVLRRILYWALDESLIQTNPLARIPLVPERRINRRVISVVEEEMLLHALPDYLKQIVITALDTGMRRGEILKQRWEDIDLHRRVLAVSSSKTAGGTGREIPLSNRVFDLLSVNPRTEGFVFTRQGKSLKWIRKGWLGGLKRAGLRHIRLHDTRHAFATRCMEAGVLQEVRQSLMGHSVGARVHSTYLHIEFPAKREAIQKLEAWINNQKQQINNKESSYGNETDRSESNPGEFVQREQVRTQTVEEEKHDGEIL